MKLYFLRHGEAGDPAQWEGNDAERPLTDDGRRRMALEARTMRRLELGVDRVITSPLLRARQTAEIVAVELKRKDRLVTDPRLGPDFGPERLVEILRDNLDGHVRLADLAGACDLSVSYFARSFKASFGVSCHRWLVDRRVERAQELLALTDTPLVEVASQSGFGDQAAFTRTFLCGHQTRRSSISCRDRCRTPWISGASGPPEVRPSGSPLTTRAYRIR